MGWQLAGVVEMGGLDPAIETLEVLDLPENGVLECRMSVRARADRGGESGGDVRLVELARRPAEVAQVLEPE